MRVSQRKFPSHLFEELHVKSTAESEELAAPSVVRNEVATGEARASHLHWIWLLLALVIPALALLPMLYFQAQRIVGQPTFYFIPVALLVGVGFLVAGCRQGPASVARSNLATAVSTLGMILAMLGIYRLSPGLAHLAFFVVILGWALGAFGSTSWTRVLAVCSLFAISIPLPGGMDQVILRRIEFGAMSACSGLLDAISIPNVAEGNLLQIEAKKLIAEECLRGMGSVFALWACALTLVLLTRTPFLTSLVLLASVPLWSLLGHLIRLSVISICLTNYAIDFSFGGAKVGLELTVFLLEVVCVFLSWVSLNGIFAPIQKHRSINSVATLYQRVALWPERNRSDEEASEIALETPPIPPEWPKRYLLLVLGCIPLLALGALSSLVVINARRASPILQITEDQAALFPGQDALPELIGSMKRTGFKVETREANNPFGQHGHVWRYEERGNQIVATLNFPFQGNHLLSNAYQRSGWKIVESGIEGPPSPLGGDLAIDQFTMQNRYGSYAYVWYASFDGNAANVNPKTKSLGSTLFSRLRPDPAEETLSKTPTYQFSLQVESGSVLKPDQLDANRDMFSQLFDRIRQQSVPALEKVR